MLRVLLRDRVLSLAQPRRLLLISFSVSDIWVLVPLIQNVDAFWIFADINVSMSAISATSTGAAWRTSLRRRI